MLQCSLVPRKKPTWISTPSYPPYPTGGWEMPQNSCAILPAWPCAVSGLLGSDTQYCSQGWGRGRD